MKSAVSMRLRLCMGNMFVKCVSVALLLLASRAPADQVEMQNGDRYLGRVISLTNDTLVVQSDYLGTLRLPRGKVALITLGQGAISASTTPMAAIPRQPSPASPAALNSAPNSPGSLQTSVANTNLIQQVQKQFLSGAGPEANDKFNELLNGYL